MYFFTSTVEASKLISDKYRYDTEETATPAINLYCVEAISLSLSLSRRTEAEASDTMLGLLTLP
jgi:hypothetical protein